MKGCSPAITKADRKRFDALQRIGCIVCWLDGGMHIPCEIHHISQADNQATIGLCAWHHRGIPLDIWGNSMTRELIGPSLYGDKRDFIAEYGTEQELLAQVNDMIREAL